LALLGTVLASPQPPMNPSLRANIEQTLDTHAVVLFMKGTPRAPQCGFSARVVQILETLGTRYEAVNVLADPALREGIKEFSSWPTIPQLYVRREFVGGCDIVTELFASGELADKLGAPPPAPPKISVTEAAEKALLAAIETADDFVRVEIGPNFEHGLSLSPKQPGDLEIQAGGLILLSDRLSAAKANGLSIAYVETPDGHAFKLDNPNEPPRVKPLTPKELKARLTSGEELRLVDVRTEEELEKAKIEGARRLDGELAAELATLDRSTPLVFVCHHGSRSARAAQQFLAEGFKNVFNLTGGIAAWSTEVDPTVPRY
jgi:monothiol glutaredoxin